MVKGDIGPVGKRNLMDSAICMWLECYLDFSFSERHKLGVLSRVDA